MIANRRLRKRLTGLSIVVSGLLFATFGSAAAQSAAPPPAAPIEQPPIEPADTQPVAQPAVQLATHQPTATLWSVEGQLGLGMPLGAIGLEASYRPLPALALAVGVGRSLFGNTQVGAMPRLDLVRLFNQKMVLSVGAGVSYGDYEQDSVAGLGNDEFIPNTLWGNFEVSFAVKAGPVGIRGFSGYSRTLSLGDSSQTSSSYFELPYLGFGLSYSR